MAPVSLLENWEEEAAKFLAPDTLSLLTAYGDSLAALRVSRDSIDAQLRSEGMVKFLKPGWRGRANVVLTTYETLRDLEFSFAAEKWSIMICDEAQRIKNPNVKHETRSAVQTLSERLGLGASHSTYRLMVAGGKAERTSTLDRVERAQPHQ